MTNTFADCLESAFEHDPRVLVDARRLNRFWKQSTSPPARWTVRWTVPALEHLRGWAGMDVVRPFHGGGRVDVPGLVHKVGNPETVYSGLLSFLSAHTVTGSVTTDPVDVLLTQPHWSDNTRRWLHHHRDVGGRGVDAVPLMAVARALEWIGQGRPIHASVLGARAGATSKFFRPGAPGRHRLAQALLFLKGSSDCSEEAEESVLSDVGVEGSATAYTVLVAGSLTVGGLDFPARLAERHQAVSLTLQNLSDVTVASNVVGVLTVENEAPFLACLTEGFHDRWILVATSGFPNRAVLSLLRFLVPQTKTWHHWGDTDLAGVRIARLLSESLGRVPDFFRCGPDDVRRWRSRLIPLTQDERQTMAMDLRQNPRGLGADVLRADLAEGGWLEQEAWQKVDLG